MTLQRTEKLLPPQLAATRTFTAMKRTGEVWPQRNPWPMSTRDRSQMLSTPQEKQRIPCDSVVSSTPANVRFPALRVTTFYTGPVDRGELNDVGVRAYDSISGDWHNPAIAKLGVELAPQILWHG